MIDLTYVYQLPKHWIAESTNDPSLSSVIKLDNARLIRLTSKFLGDVVQPLQIGVPQATLSQVTKSV